MLAILSSIPSRPLSVWTVSEDNWKQKHHATIDLLTQHEEVHNDKKAGREKALVYSMARVRAVIGGDWVHFDAVPALVVDSAWPSLVVKLDFRNRRVTRACLQSRNDPGLCMYCTVHTYFTTT